MSRKRIELLVQDSSQMIAGASTLLCTPASLSQAAGLALGAPAGKNRLREVVTGGRFSRFGQVAQIPSDLIFEAKP
jgi:hypothetical protein